MKKTLFFLLLFTASFLQAQHIDMTLLSKMNGKKWTLTTERKNGRLFSRKEKKPPKETITFSGNTILFDLPDVNYACNYSVKNKTELWLYCTEPDQYVYRVRVLTNSEMVFDVLVKDRSGKYVKRERQYFQIAP